MALRTFSSNPSLGGFGWESSRISGRGGDNEGGVVEADAFAQILKELVDNAVDACRSCEQNNTSAVATARVTGRESSSNRNNSINNGSSNKNNISRRVLIKILPEPTTTTTNGNADEGEDNEEALLRVTVTDNGCGMSDIQSCVDPFHTNKAHNATTTTASQSQQNSNNSPNETVRNTAGRYGIGLTLCLLHAQRLVPNTSASIQSATANCPHYTKVTCLVDTQHDAVRCLPQGHPPKAFAAQSGTSISLLLPGGQTAQAAWPRLALYFSNFWLSLGLSCSLQVMAPSLSHQPLYVRPSLLEQPPAPAQQDRSNESQVRRPNRVSVSPQGNSQQLPQDDENMSEDWIDIMEAPVGENDPILFQNSRIQSQHRDKDDESGNSSDESIGVKVRKKATPATPQEQIRNRLRLAAQKHLGRDILLENVAHAIVPIRQPPQQPSLPPPNDRPQLEVNIIVHNQDPHADDDENDNSDDHEGAAQLSLVRMVNRVPLLDSAAAIACGLVQGIAASQLKKLWTSVGLTIAPSSCQSDNRIPTFAVKDSDQVAPFFQQYHRRNHRIYSRQGDVWNEDSEEEDVNTDSEGEDETDQSDMNQGKKRRRRPRQHHRHIGSSEGEDWLKPAHSRLGNILVVVHIHANPTVLPLPTLCKGRLPLEDKPILTALEVCLTRCLRELQKNNPSLFLTTKQLKTVERNVKFVPALAQALTSIVTNQISSHDQEDDDESVIDRYLRLAETAVGQQQQLSQEVSPADLPPTSKHVLLESLIEERLRTNIAQHAEWKKARAKKKRVGQQRDSRGTEEQEEQSVSASVGSRRASQQDDEEYYRECNEDFGDSPPFNENLNQRINRAEDMFSDPFDSP